MRKVRRWKVVVTCLLFAIIPIMYDYLHRFSVLTKKLSSNEKKSLLHNAQQQLPTTSRCVGTTTSDREKEQFLLTPMFDGRLGNLMFLYASVYSMAVSKNMRVYVPDNNQLRKLFNLDNDVVTNKNCKDWTSVTSPCCDYDSTLESKIVTDKCQKVGEFLQSWKYFDRYNDSIRKQFTFKTEIENSARTKLSFILKTYKQRGIDNGNFTRNVSTVLGNNTFHNVTLIGLHARRGDYLSTAIINQGRITPPVDYYIRAMNYFRKRFSNPVFVASSDSTSWLEQNLKGPNVVILHGDKPEEDLCILSMCNHTIMSVGTFGWWAGYLAGGTTLFFQKTPNDKSFIGERFRNYKQDFIYKGWIGIE